ncbi:MULTISPECIES: hypothetical protein [Bacillus]|uniref:hypothetical protein n=1 Tax=Bacillus TaxID=1386 RepID=UPI0002D2B2E0|nr:MULTISPECIES: hypothetical protein [Bacillus]
MRDFQIHFNGLEYSVFYEYCDGNVYWETIQDGFETKEDAIKWVDGTNAVLDESEERRERELWIGVN